MEAFRIIYFQFYDFQDNYIENLIPFSRPYQFLSMFSENKNPSFTTRMYHFLSEIN